MCIPSHTQKPTCVCVYGTTEHICVNKLLNFLFMNYETKFDSWLSLLFQGSPGISVFKGINSVERHKQFN